MPNPVDPNKVRDLLRPRRRSPAQPEPQPMTPTGLSGWVGGGEPVSDTVVTREHRADGSVEVTTQTGDQVSTSVVPPPTAGPFAESVEPEPLTAAQLAGVKAQAELLAARTRNE